MLLLFAFLLFFLSEVELENVVQMNTTHAHILIRIQRVYCYTDYYYSGRVPDLSYGLYDSWKQCSNSARTLKNLMVSLPVFIRFESFWC